MTYVRTTTVVIRVKTMSKSAVDTDQFDRSLRLDLVRVANQKIRQKRCDVQLVEEARFMDTYR